MSKYIITFAGVPGSSKTPIAQYLSWKLGLPIYNNDALRNELREDILSYDVEAFKKLHNKRFGEALELGRSFIYDASIDRTWPLIKDRFDSHGYTHFVISLDLSRGLLEKLYIAKGYDQFAIIDSWSKDHETFLKEHAAVVNIHITDKNFLDRMKFSFDAASKWTHTLQ